MYQRRDEQLTLPFGADHKSSNPAYMWPCVNCGTSTWVSKNIFTNLKEGALTGILCGNCLPSPDGSNRLLEAA